LEDGRAVGFKYVEEKDDGLREVVYEFVHVGEIIVCVWIYVSSL
jgi:hypothetical protein